MAAPLNIAVVEDHDDLRELTVALLRAQGHRVAGLASAEALDLSASPVPDVFLIDLNLPGEDGLSLADRVRAAHPRAGIVMVTARKRAADRIDGYGHGADLYLPKPVPPEELIAAIHALARRLPAAGDGAAMSMGSAAGAAATAATSSAAASAPASATASQAASTTATAPQARPTQPLTLDTTLLRLVGPRGTVDLTPAEAALIAALAQAPRRQLGLARIADALGVELQQLSKASLEVRVVRLRRKLGEAGADAQAIKAVRGYGYQLCTSVLLGK